MDNLILDADSLFAIADVISGYCAQQRETLNVYYAQIKALESEWRDDETFGAIVYEIYKLKTNAIVALDEIKEMYPKYFREKARLILSRPTMQTTSGSMSSATTSSYGGLVRSVEYTQTSSNESYKTERTIPGTAGIVTGGDSTKLGKNMLSEMGVSRDLKWGASGYQAHHIIPKEKDIAMHPVIQKIGMDFDDASNGIFLKTPNDGVNAKSIHHGYHEEYSNAIKEYLDGLDLSQRVEVLEQKVAIMQQRLKSSLENGLPLYMKKKNSTTGPVTYQHKGGGATSEMWSDVINALSDDEISTFENNEYETYKLTEPLTVYRYFGSYTSEEMSEIKGNEFVSSAEDKLNDIDDAGWGSAAGGKFLALNPNLTSEQAKDLLALKPEWGNNAAYIATIELPVGTRISIGKAATQKCANGDILHGGETQIIMHEEWTTEKVRARVKSCKAIDN